MAGRVVVHQQVRDGAGRHPQAPAAVCRSLAADGRLASVYFSAPPDSAGTSTFALFDLTTGAREQTFHPDGPAAYSSAFNLQLSPQADLVSAGLH
jgi:hypothetical protein